MMSPWKYDHMLQDMVSMAFRDPLRSLCLFIPILRPSVIPLHTMQILTKLL